MKITTLIILSVIFSSLLITSFYVTSPILAQTQSQGTQSQGTQSSGNNEVKLTNPLGNKEDPAIIIGDIVKAILGISGLIALLAFVFGGVTWMTSGGNPEKVKKGRDMLVWAIIGLLVVFSSYTLLRYVFEALQ